MDPENFKDKYSSWFSYHLNHVYYERRKSAPIHRFPWTYCGHCGYAMRRARYTSSNNQFGLPTKYSLENQRRVESQVSAKTYTVSLLCIVWPCVNC